MRRKVGKVLRATEKEALANGGVLDKDDVPADMLPIVMNDLKVTYKVVGGPLAEKLQASVSKKTPVLRPRRQSFLQITYAKQDIENSLESSDKEKKEKSTSRVAQARWKRLDTNRTSIVAMEPTTDAAKEQAAVLMIQKHIRQHKISKVYQQLRVQDGLGFQHLNMRLPQGKLVAIVGPPSEGKGTVMRLLSADMFPTFKEADSTAMPDASNGSSLAPGSFFVPPHLRVVAVQETPMILGPKESIFENITFGIKMSPATDLVALETRARAIARRLGLSTPLLNTHFKKTNYVGASGARITRTDRQIISLSRAFLMNPEFMVVHKPDALLSPEQSASLLAMMREYVAKRGVELDSKEPLVKRRRRTLVFTASRRDLADKAELIFEAKGGHVAQIKGAELV